MIFSTLYYLASTAIFSAGALGVYYWIDRPGAQSLMAKATWYSMRTYIQASEFFTEGEKNSDNEGEEYNEEESNDTYIHYTLEPEEALVTSFVNEKTREDIKKNHITDLEMVSTKINGKKYFKILENDTVLLEIDYLPIEKQFIQVELEQNNKKMLESVFFFKFGWGNDLTGTFLAAHGSPSTFFQQPTKKPRSH